jgi:hypothetical protein
MITMLAAAVVVLTGISNISTIANGRHHLRPPVIGRTVAVELQRHSPVAKEASQQRMTSLQSLLLQKRTLKKSSITSPRFSPVSATTITAIGTLWVMPKNLGTAQAASFSADPPLQAAQHATTMLFPHFVGDACTIAA